MPAVILFLAFVSVNFLSPFLILRKIWTQSFCGILRTIRSLWTELSDIYMVDCLEAGGLVCISIFPLLSLPGTFFSAFDYHVLIVYGIRSRAMTFHVRSAYMAKSSLLSSPPSPSILWSINSLHSGHPFLAALYEKEHEVLIFLY